MKNDFPTIRTIDKFLSVTLRDAMKKRLVVGEFQLVSTKFSQLNASYSSNAPVIIFLIGPEPRSIRDSITLKIWATRYKPKNSEDPMYYIEEAEISFPYFGQTVGQTVSCGAMDVFSADDLANTLIGKMQHYFTPEKIKEMYADRRGYINSYGNNDADKAAKFDILQTQMYQLRVLSKVFK